MKQFVYILFFAFLGVSTQAQKINWMTFDQAISAQKKAPKPIFIDVYTNWCGPCKLLDQNTFSNPEFAKFINANYYAVKFNAEGNESITFSGTTFTNPRYDANRINSRNSMHEFTAYLQIQAYPSMIVIDTKAKVSRNIMGYRTPDELLAELK